MNRQLWRTVWAMGALAVADRALGAARHMVVAAHFGAGAAMDLLVIGLSCGDLAVALLLGSFHAVFVPLHAGWEHAAGLRAADRRGWAVVRGILPLLLLAAAGLAIGGPLWAAWRDLPAGDARVLATRALPWLGPYVLASGATILLVGFFRARQQFVGPQVAQLVTRIAGIVLIVGLAPLLGPVAFTIALAGGALLTPVVLLAMLPGPGRPVAPETAAPEAEAAVSPTAPREARRAYLGRWLPLAGGAVIDQSVVFTDRLMAATLSPGAVSALYYGGLLWALPGTLITKNAGALLLPRLSAEVAAGGGAPLRHTLRRTLRLMILVMTPATILTCAGARDAVGLLFERGLFTGAAADLTAAVLAGLGLCLVPQGIGAVFNLLLYSTGRTRLVALSGLTRLGLNTLLNIVFMRWWGAVGIAVSTSVTLVCWVVLVSWPFRRELARRGVASPLDRELADMGLRAAVAGLGCLAAMAATQALPLLAGTTVEWRLARLAAAGAAGLSVYAALLLLLKVSEAQAVARRLPWISGRRVAA